MSNLRKLLGQIGNRKPIKGGSGLKPAKEVLGNEVASASGSRKPINKGVSGLKLTKEVLGNEVASASGCRKPIKGGSGLKPAKEVLGNDVASASMLGKEVLRKDVASASMLGKEVLRHRLASGLKLEKEILGVEVSDQMRYIGLENLGNTCYCNSVLQALYFCVPFREHLLVHANQSANVGCSNENLLTCLSELFNTITSKMVPKPPTSGSFPGLLSDKKTGVIAPKRFIKTLKQQNVSFRNYMHQDAHEFLNYLLNNLVETLEKEAKGRTSRPSGRVEELMDRDQQPNPPLTWVQELFQGTMRNETLCLLCRTVTERKETFIDLSLDIEEDSSITSCIEKFSSTEVMKGKEQFFCDKCNSLQDALKKMTIKSLPRIIALHLKRFKYVERLGLYDKLCCRVAFPKELTFGLTTDEGAPEPDQEYSLFAVVVHVGRGTSYGHYITLAKCKNQWLLFNDENVEVVHEMLLERFFGSTEALTNNAGQAYILFYENLEGRH